MFFTIFRTSFTTGTHWANRVWGYEYFKQFIIFVISVLMFEIMKTFILKSRPRSRSFIAFLQKHAFWTLLDKLMSVHQLQLVQIWYNYYTQVVIISIIEQNKNLLRLRKGHKVKVKYWIFSIQITKISTFNGAKCMKMYQILSYLAWVSYPRRSIIE